MAADELTKALLLEEVAAPRAIADALFASVNGGVPLLQALVDSGAATPDVLGRYLSRGDTPFLRHVVPIQELVERLPRGLCARLLAIPVRRDAITGTIDIVVADPADPHPASEISFHLNAPIRVIRAPVSAIEEALRRLRMQSREDTALDRFNEAAARAAILNDDDGIYDSRPRGERPQSARHVGGHQHLQQAQSHQQAHAQSQQPHSLQQPPRDSAFAKRLDSLPPPEPALSNAMPSRDDVPPRKGGLVIEPDTVPPPPAPAPRMRTPPWGTPIHMINAAPATEPPKSGYGSEIPIPLTRRTIGPASMAAAVASSGDGGSAASSSFNPVPPPTGGGQRPQPHDASVSPFRGGTERPPSLANRSPNPLINPMPTGLGEGYAFDATGFRDVVEKAAPRIAGIVVPSVPAVASAAGVAMPPMGQPIGSFIPGPPPLPGMGPFAAYAPQLPFPEMGGILAALRNAGSRDEVLELVLTGARMVALKVALFVVKKGGYLGWVATPEFAERSALQSVLIPIEANSIFDRAVREDLYLGPVRYDEVHAPLLRVMRNPSRDVAAVPIRVSGKTAVIIVADELGDTMIGTRRLEELARAAGEAFARIVRTRR